jgi:hypothetical protein
LRCMLNGTDHLADHLLFTVHRILDEQVRKHNTRVLGFDEFVDKSLLFLGNSSSVSAI